jgi:hypothetical protein
LKKRFRNVNKFEKQINRIYRYVRLRKIGLDPIPALNLFCGLF